MEKRKSKSYLDGYDFAIRYIEEKLTKEENLIFDEDSRISLDNYNPYTDKLSKRLFNKGKKHAIEYMWEQNEKISDAQEILNDSCFDSEIEMSRMAYEIVEVCENKKAMEKLLQKYDDGVCAIIKLFEEAQLKDHYEI